MIKLNRKKVFLLCGYVVFNFFVLITYTRVLGRLGAAFGRLDFDVGEVLSHILASLLPSPF